MTFYYRPIVLDSFKTLEFFSSILSRQSWGITGVWTIPTSSSLFITFTCFYVLFFCSTNCFPFFLLLSLFPWADSYGSYGIQVGGNNKKPKCGLNVTHSNFSQFRKTGWSLTCCGCCWNSSQSVKRPWVPCLVGQKGQTILFPFSISDNANISEIYLALLL